MRENKATLLDGRVSLYLCVSRVHVGVYLT